MKTLSFALLCGFVCTGSSWAQQLRGSFYTVEKERGFSEQLFQFSGRRFFYVASGCLGTTQGQGTFAVVADSLMLYFEKSPADTGRVRAYRPCASATATPTFCLRVLDRSTGDKLLGATISSQKTPAGASTNSDGEASFAYLPPAGDALTVQFVGYNRVTIPLTAATSQGFTVRLGPPYYFAPGDTLTFQLQKDSPNRLTLRPRLRLQEINDSAISYSHCSRITAAEARKIIQR